MVSAHCMMSFIGPALSDTSHDFLHFTATGALGILMLDIFMLGVYLLSTGALAGLTARRAKNLFVLGLVLMVAVFFWSFYEKATIDAAAAQAQAEALARMQV